MSRKGVHSELKITPVLGKEFLTGSNFVEVTNSQIDTVTMFEVNFVSGVAFIDCGVNKISLGKQFIGRFSLSNNNIQSINLDALVSIGSIDLTGNPLDVDTVAYIETKTNLDITY